MDSRLQMRIKRQKKRRKRVLVTLLVVMILGGSTLLITQVFSLKHVVIEGSEKYTEEEMLEHLVQKKTDKVTFLMYLRYYFGSHDKIPFLEKYKLSMIDNHTIKVKTYEKMIIGCVELMGNYMYFDRDGIVVESSKKHLPEIPLIEGLQFSQIVLNEPIIVQNQSMFDTIMNLTQQIKRNDLKVSQISFDDSYEVTLTCENNQVLLGKQEFYDEQLSALADVLTSAGDKKMMYDFRYYYIKDKMIIAKPLP